MQGGSLLMGENLKWNACRKSICWEGSGRQEHLMQTLGDDGKYKKCQKIKETWKSGHGIIILKSFHHSTSFEASTREAILIDFFGVDKLTNIRRRTHYKKVGELEQGKIWCAYRNQIYA